MLPVWCSPLHCRRQCTAAEGPPGPGQPGAPLLHTRQQHPQHPSCHAAGSCMHDQTRCSHLQHQEDRAQSMGSQPSAVQIMPFSEYTDVWAHDTNQPSKYAPGKFRLQFVQLWLSLRLSCSMQHMKNARDQYGIPLPSLMRWYHTSHDRIPRTVVDVSNSEPPASPVLVAEAQQGGGSTGRTTMDLH
jgi:hypothetical protein